jgi:putative sterol carrier protein
MSRMQKAFMPEKAPGIDAVIQYNLTGAEASDWIITIKDGKCAVEQGKSPNPKMTLMADSQDYKDIIMGKLNAMTAFMQGKVKVSGDLNLAMKLTSYFKMT